MGVKNLIKFIKKYSPDAINYTNIINYKNKTIGIDANLLLYKLIYAIRANGYDLTNGDIIITHIHALLLKLLAFKYYNINAVFVFDSLAPEIKYYTLEERKKTRQKLINKYKKSMTDKGKRIFYYIKSDITLQEINDCRELINIFDYTIIDAKEEADAQLVQLYKANLIDFIASDDMDILLFGGEILLKNFSVAKNKKIQEINLKKLLESADISQDQLIKIGILMGTDYCDIKNISPSKAYHLVKEYKHDDYFIPSIGYKCEPAFNYFKDPPVFEIDQIIVNNNIKSRDLINFLKRFNFSTKYINKIFEKIKDSY